jgi:hypothetical protein
VTAVAVWDHKPEADEVLEARLAEGWRPQPSALREGDRVLGHAACRIGSMPDQANAGLDQ